MLSPDDGWIVGYEAPAQPKSGQLPKSVVLRYSGGVWSRVPSPPTLDAASISPVSATEAWAAGGGSVTQVAPRDESITQAFVIAEQSKRCSWPAATSHTTATCPLSLISQRPFSVTPLHPLAVGPLEVSGGAFGP